MSTGGPTEAGLRGNPRYVRYCAANNAMSQGGSDRVQKTAVRPAKTDPPARRVMERLIARRLVE